MTPACEEMLMILPPPFLIMAGTRAFASRKGARRLTAMVASQSAEVASSSGAIKAMAALLTRMSTVPKAASASFAACAGPSTVAMTAAMSAPASASTLQVSSPMPLVAPVTSAALPSSPKRFVHSAMAIFLFLLELLFDRGEGLLVDVLLGVRDQRQIVLRACIPVAG